MKSKISKGFTLIELIIVIALLGIVSTVAFSLLIFGNKVYGKIIEEYEIQSSFRLVLEKTNNTIRYSTALFTIPESSFRENNLASGWDYIGLSDDKTELVNYTWNKSLLKHDKKVIIPKKDNLIYNLKFEKENPHDKDSLLRFYIEVSNDSKTFTKVSLSSELETLNSLQIIDYGSLTDTATALAYSNEERTDRVVGHIAMVMDVSGSMTQTIGGSSSQKIAILRDEAKKLIDGFAQESNIDISLVPFATSANNPKPFRNARLNTSELKADVNSLTADGGTNTGDGLRRAYWKLKEHNDDLSEGVSAKNYTIILVDGETTFASVEATTTLNWVIDNQDILDSSSQYRHRSPYNSTGQIAGNGSNYDTTYGKPYVNLMGQNLKDNDFSKTYVIGFYTNPNDPNLKANIINLANACGAPANRIFNAGSSSDLTKVFDNIKQEIINDLWYLQGPKL